MERFIPCLVLLAACHPNHVYPYHPCGDPVRVARDRAEPSASGPSGSDLEARMSAAAASALTDWDPADAAPSDTVSFSLAVREPGQWWDATYPDDSTGTCPQGHGLEADLPVRVGLGVASFELAEPMAIRVDDQGAITVMGAPGGWVIDPPVPVRDAVDGQTPTGVVIDRYVLFLGDLWTSMSVSVDAEGHTANGDGTATGITGRWYPEGVAAP